jgi:hypothetical protein
LGVADAVKNKYLATMQLSIYDGELSQSKMAEAYTMEFSYGPDTCETGLKIGVGGFPGPTDAGTDMVTAKDGMSLLVYDLIMAMGKPSRLTGET